jgi:hypothetical protein
VEVNRTTLLGDFHRISKMLLRVIELLYSDKQQMEKGAVINALHYLKDK